MKTQHLDIPELSVQCEQVIQKAKADLGEDLGGGSRLDLVADQIPYARLDDLEAALKLMDECALVRSLEALEDEYDANPPCTNPKGHSWNDDSYCSNCGADGAA